MDQSIPEWLRGALDAPTTGSASGGDEVERAGTKSARLVATIASEVAAGNLPVGTRLPAERRLALALGVARGTVVAAYEELAAAAIVERRQGAGTFVATGPGWAREPSANPTAALLLRRRDDTGTIDLSLSVPADTSHLPAPLGGATLDLAPGHGLDPQGSLELREAIARHLTEQQGLPTDPAQLVVTSGAQQALALVAQAVVEPGSRVLSPCPTFPGLGTVIAARGATIVPLAADDAAGLQPESVARELRRRAAALLYVAPTGHNPTGSVMPRARREDLAAALGMRRSIVVVEDLTLADLCLDEAPPAPLAAIRPETVAVGSISKLLWAGLRVGWVRCDEPLRTAILRLKAAADLGTSVPSQVLAARQLRAVDPAWLDGHRKRLRSRRDLLIDLLAERLPAWRIDVPPASGLSVWARVPSAAEGNAGGSVERLAALAERAGVRVAVGASACHDGRHHDHLRLSFAEHPDVLTLAVDRLASTLS